MKTMELYLKAFRRMLALVCILLSIPIYGQQIIVETITEEFDGSGGLNIGKDGKLYVANFGESLDNANGTQVWVIDYKKGGQPVLFASGLSGASGNDFDSKGNLFQSNIAAGTVSKIDPDGNTSFFVSNGITCNVGINIDAEDNLYICNCCGGNGNTIRKVTKDGVSTLFSSSNLFFCPNGITRDKDKHIIDSEMEDVLYVACRGSHRIYKLTPDGELTVLAGSGIRGNDDGSAMEATFSRPNGLALSETEDTLFVNSSIPVTDAGGRPLNPSVIRMITGLRGTTESQELPVFVYSLIYDSPNRSIKLSDLSLQNQDIEVALYTQEGKTVLKKLVQVNSEKVDIPVPLNVSNGIYFISIKTPFGVTKSASLFIY